MKNFLAVVVTAAFAAVVPADAFRFSSTTGGSRTRLQQQQQHPRRQYFVDVIKSTHQTINCRNCYDHHHHHQNYIHHRRNHPSSSIKLYAAISSSQTTPDGDDADDNDDDNIDIESQYFDTQGQQNRQWLVETFNCTKESLSKKLEPSRYNAIETSELIYRANYLKKRLKLTDQEMNKMIQKCPRLLRMPVESKSGPILDCLEETFGKKSLKKMMMKHPQVVASRKEDTEIQFRSFKWLEERLGLSDDQIAKIIGRQPQILYTSVSKTLEPKIEWIQEKLSLSNSDLANMVARQPSLLHFNITKNLEPTINFYMDSIETDEDVIPFILKDPAILTCSLEKRLKPRLAEAQEAGLIIDVTCLRRIARGTPEDWDRSLN